MKANVTDCLSPECRCVQRELHMFQCVMLGITSRPTASPGILSARARPARWAPTIPTRARSRRVRRVSSASRPTEQPRPQAPPARPRAVSRSTLRRFSNFHILRGCSIASPHHTEVPWNPQNTRDKHAVSTVTRGVHSDRPLSSATY